MFWNIASLPTVQFLIDSSLVPKVMIIQVVYNHWTGLVDWTSGLTFFVLKITIVLSTET